MPQVLAPCAGNLLKSKARHIYLARTCAAGVLNMISTSATIALKPAACFSEPVPEAEFMQGGTKLFGREAPDEILGVQMVNMRTNAELSQTRAEARK